VCVCLRVFVKKRLEFKFVLRVLFVWVSFGYVGLRRAVCSGKTRGNAYVCVRVCVCVCEKETLVQLCSVRGVAV